MDSEICLRFHESLFHVKVNLPGPLTLPLKGIFGVKVSNRTTGKYLKKISITVKLTLFTSFHPEMALFLRTIRVLRPTPSGRVPGYAISVSIAESLVPASAGRVIP